MKNLTAKRAKEKGSKGAQLIFVKISFNIMEGGKEIIREGEKEKLPDNVVVVERPEARYRIIYEKHEGSRSPEEIGKPTALAVEFISATGYGRKFAAEALAESYWEEKRQEAGGNSSEENYVKQNRIPLYFIDVTDPGREILDKARLASVWVKAAQTSLAGGFTASMAIEAIRKAKSEQKLSRREFLGFLGGAAGTAFLGIQLLDFLVKLALAKEKTPPGEATLTRKIQRKVGAAAERIHPETEAILLTFRNALWAQKLETIAGELQKEIGRKPDITFSVGAEHFGLEEMLGVASESRIESIKNFLNVFGLKSAAQELSAIARVEYSAREARWIATKIINDPELKKIEKTLWPGNTQ
ncbi:MAG: twin-arginine translocation signal domain-containing protein [Candidatus Sungiibacteriota bacterium]